MAVVHLSMFLGGAHLMGFVSAVAFATILAVVAGLSLAGAATISHDIYAQLLRRGTVTEREEVTVSRISVVFIGAIAIGLAILFQKQNLAFLAVAAQSVAASVNFPLLLLCTTWRGLTTRGAVVGGIVGVVCALGLLVTGPNVWVEVLDQTEPLFPLQYPTIVALPVTLLTTYFVSVFDRSLRAREDRAAFDHQLLRAEGVSPSMMLPAAAVDGSVRAVTP
ncbi:MAG: hypothetical protein IPJ97_13250 [Proteobacteria bacterium]|nr:hypothetical protein [Pseudomonadota bacterium]